MLTEELLVPKHAELASLEMTYYDSQDDKNRDDVLVLVHGTAGSTASHFGFLFPVLAAKQRVISIDWSNPSEESGSSPLQLEHLANQVIELIERTVPGRKVALLGYSLGAVVTAVVAAQRPDLVDRLILVSGWIKTDQQQLLRNDIWRTLRDLDDDTVLRQYSTFCAFGGPFLADKTRDELAPGMNAMKFDHFGDRQMDLNRRIDITESAHTIECPTLVVGCTHDQMVPVRHQQALFGAIQDSRYVEIPTGHAVVFERPSELSHHIQQFMDLPDQYPAGTIIPTPAP